MATPMPPVTGNATIASGLFVSMQLDATTYYFSDSYATITVDGNPYTDLGHLMQVGDFTYDYQRTPNALQITIVGVPNTTYYMKIEHNRQLHCCG